MTCLFTLSSSLTACEKATAGNEETVQEEQTENNEQNMNTTAIILHFGEQLDVPATLNNTLTAQEFKKILPFTCRTTHYDLDFCGSVSKPLPEKSGERYDGWKNGDIAYGDGWFSVLVDGEEISAEQYGKHMVIGHIDESYLDRVRAIKGSVTIKVELAE